MAEVAKCTVSIWADSSPFRRELATLGRSTAQAARVRVEADTSGMKRGIDQATRGMKAKIPADLDTGPALRGIASLRTAMGVLSRDIKIRADTDFSPAIAGAMALRGGLDAAGSSISRFNRMAMTMRNIASVAARVGLASLITYLAPLTGMAGIAAAGLASLASGAGLLAAAFLPGIAAITQHTTAQEGLETASSSLEDQEQALAEAVENQARVQEEAARSIEGARQDRARTAEELRRTEIRAAEQIEAATQRVAEQRAAVEEAERTRSENIQQERATYQTLLSDLNRIEVENAARLKEQRDAAREADTEYFRTLEENATRLAEARAAVNEQERENARLAQQNSRAEAEALEALGDTREEYTDLVEENSQREREQRESVAEAESDVADVIEDQNERVADSRQEAADAAQAVADQERAVQEEREELSDRTEDLRDAQLSLNEAIANQPEQRAQARLDVDRTAFELEQAQAEEQEALLLGDQERAREIGFRIRQLELELAQAKELNNELARGPSEEVKRAREEVERALEARDEQREQVREARRRVDELEVAAEVAQSAVLRAISERDEAISAAFERVAEERESLRDIRREAADSESEYRERIEDERQALIQLRQDNNIAERDGERRLNELRGEVVAVQEENAQREEDALARRREARAAIAQVEEENARALLEGQERANAQLEAIESARVEGNTAVEQSESALASALRERRRLQRDLGWEISDQRDRLNESAQAYRDAQVQAESDVEDATEAVIAQRSAVADAEEEVAEAAAKSGTVLTASQAALLAAATGFAASFTAAFKPAQDTLGYLAVDILNLAERALPYLGGVAADTASKLAGVFQEMRGVWTDPTQLGLFTDFFDRIPGIMEDAASAALQFGTGLFNALVPAMPFVEDLFNWLDDIAARFLEWTQSAEGQRQLHEFFETAAYFAGILKDVLVDVAKFIYQIGMSEGARNMAENFAQVVNAIARHPEGIQQALWTLGRLGDVLVFLLNLPGLGGLAVNLATFAGTMALFGGGAILGGLGALWGFYRVLRLLGAGRLTSGVARGLRPLAVRGGIFDDIALRVLYAGDAVGRMAARFGRVPGIVWRSLRSIPALVGRSLGGLGRLAGRMFGAVLGEAWRLVRLERIVSRAFSGLGGIVMRSLRGAGRWFTPLLRVVAGVFGGNGRILSIIGGLGRWLPRIVPRVFGIIPALAIETLRGGIRNIRWVFTDFLPNVLRPALRLIPRILSDPFARTPAEIRNRMIDSLKRWPMMGPILSVIDGFLDWARNALPNAFKWIGQSMIFGWISGLWSKARDLFDTLTDMAKEAWERVRSFFDSRSPSRRMMWLGQTISDGITEGIKRGIPGVRTASLEMSRAASFEPHQMSITRPLPSSAASMTYQRPHIGGASSFADSAASLASLRSSGDRPLVLHNYTVLDGKIIDERIIRTTEQKARQANRRRTGSDRYPY